jgi:5-methylcytosine-specific restriction enzyme A
MAAAGAALMARSVPEWIGKTDDEPVPNRVRIRVCDRDGWKCCGCGRSMWEGTRINTDHKIALANGGQNRESNLQTLCDWCHKEKTAEDVAQKSRTYRSKERRARIRKTKQPIRGWRKFDGTPVRNPNLQRRGAKP